MLDVICAPNPILLEKSEEVEPGEAGIAELANQMAEVMYTTVGVGLAAVQVGVHKRLIVVDCDWDYEAFNPKKPWNKQGLHPIFLVNPKIVDASEEMEESDEGCLSCPGVTAPVMRHKTVTVEYFDLQGKPQTITGEELLSHCLQHEIDHLEGKTLFQTCDAKYRLELLQRYQQARAAGAEPGQVGQE